MLKILNSKTIILDEQEVSINKEILMGILDVDVELDENLTIGDLIHLVYDISGFINDYFVEEYEAVRSLVAMGKFISPALKLKLQKKIEDDEDVLHVNNVFELILPEGDAGSVEVKDLTFQFDKDLLDADEILIKKKTATISLLNVLEIIFVDFIHSLRNDAVLQ